MRPLTIETVEELISSSDSASADQRRAAFETFAAMPMPSPKDEAWRYVDLDMDLDRYGLAAAPGDPIPDDAFVTSVSDATGRATIVDGFVTGVEHEGSATFEARLDLPGDVLRTGADKFSAAQAAFAGEGVLLDVPAGTTIDRPYVIDLQSTQDHVISFPSVSVRLGEDAEVSVLLIMRSTDGAVAHAPSVTLVAGDAARLRYTSAQVMGSKAISIVRQQARAGNDATVRLGEVGLGGTFSRVDLGAELRGNGSSVEVVGLYFGEHEQVLDYRLVMNHIGRNTSSDVFLKGAVEDAARSVFTGLLRIEEDAVRTSAFETNRNLVLSPGAKAHSVPTLEILCNDVVCGHASSVGPLEEEHLYYLQSRGISRARAERLLIRGFFSEVIDRLPSTRLAGPIRDVVYRRFSEAQEAGRIAL